MRLSLYPSYHQLFSPLPHSSFIIHTCFSGRYSLRTKFSHLLTLCLCALVLAGCERVGSTTEGERAASSAAKAKSKLYAPPARLADLEDRAITESSGIVASRRSPDIF